MRKHASLFLILIPIAFAAVAPPSYSQATTAFAQLNGTVRDTSGGFVAKASIALREVDTNREYTAVSNETGFYVVPNLPPGRYEFSIEYKGFAKYTQTGIVLSVGQAATIDVTLKIASGGEKVVVTMETPVIEPTRTEVSQVIATQQIESLPISGRLFTDFALLSPGVATGRTSLQSTFTDPATTRISFGGQRDLNNAVTVDGADNINTATGSQRATPSQEAVSEFRVVNNSFGAEYGRALGGIVNIVTKSGTNVLHGSVYDYLQNNSTNAKSILTLPGFNTLRQNQFGATLGGPLQKDRTFFFVNFEGQRRGQSPTYPGLLASNLAAINALKASFGIAPENLNVLKTADVNNGFIKIEHQLNNANRLSVRYSIQDATNLNMLVGETLDGGGIGAPSSGRNGLLRDQALVGTWTSQITPTLVNSLLGQWARRNYGFPGVTGQPNLDVPNLLLFGHNFGAFDRYNESRVQLGDTISWVKGKHYAKFGFDTNYIRNFVIWPGFTPSRDIFPSLGDLLASGKPGWGAAPCPPPLVGLVAPCIAAFFWGAPIGPGPFNPNQASPSVPTTWQNAFLPSQAQNFFTGLPTSNNMQTGTWLLNSMFLPTPCVLPGCPTPPPGSPLPPGTVPPPLLTSAFENLINSGSFPNNSLFVQGGSVVDRNERKPYTEQSSLEIDREIGKGLSVSAGYMFVAGHKLVRPIDLNVGPPIGKETGTNKDIYAFAINDPNIPAPPLGSHGTNGIFYFTDSSGNSVYHGLTLQATEKAGKYFRLNANYTFSKTLDDGTYLVFVDTPQSNAQRNLERADSNQDLRHRFVANFVADAPQQWFVRNFELSSIVTLQSARPFTLFVGFDATNDGNPVTDRVGVSARNTYRGDSLKAVDLRLSRVVHLKERAQLNLSVDAFNLFNRSNVDEVFSVYGAPDFVGPVPRHFGDSITGPSGAVGSPRTVFNPRQLQFGLKLSF